MYPSTHLHITMTALVCELIWILVTLFMSSRREVMGGGGPYSGQFMYWNWVTVRVLRPSVICESEKYYTCQTTLTTINLLYMEIVMQPNIQSLLFLTEVASFPAISSFLMK